jgi:hypothetical protein
MPVEVVDFFEVVGIDQVENQVAIARVRAARARPEGTQHLVDVGLDRHLEEPPVARAGKWVGERRLAQFLVRVLQLLPVPGNGQFQTSAFLLQRVGAQLKKRI